MDGLMNKKSRDGKDTSNWHGQAFLQIANEVSDNHLKKGVVYSLTRLTTRCRQLLQQLEDPLAKCYRTHNMKNRLSAHSGDRIQFLNPKGISTLACSSHITIEHMRSEVLKLSKELDDSATVTDSENSDTNESVPSNSNTHLYMSANCLRGQIKEKAQQQRICKDIWYCLR